MSTGAALAAVVAVGLLTFGSRSVPILFLAGRRLPQPVERGLRYVGPAVLSALVVTLVAGAGGHSGVDGAELAALVTAALAGWRTRNLVISMTAGMIALWIVDWLLP